MHAKLPTTIIFLTTLALATNAWASRLACFYFDKSNPLGGSAAKVFGPALSFEWAKNFSNREDFLEGQAAGGFYEVSNISKSEAKNLCLDTLKKTYPKAQIKLMHMAVRTSLWSKPQPAVFLKDEEEKYTKLVIVGDSLSDQGRMADLIKIVPSKPYFAGRFSNGYIWVDYLQEMVEISVQNLAIAGSLSGAYPELNLNKTKPWTQRVHDNWGLYFSGTFQDQIENYKKSLHGHEIKDDTIFLIWGGSNDYLAFLDGHLADIFLDEPDNKLGYNSIIDRVTDNILESIKKIRALGGRNFLIPNLPNIGKLPRVFENTTYAKDAPHEKRLVSLSTNMSNISIRHNILLLKKILALKEGLDINITLVDIFGGLDKMDVPFMAKEISYEGKQASIGQACYANYSYYPFRKEAPICHPQEAFFWDAVHPTTYGHYLLAWFIHQAGASQEYFRKSSLEEYFTLYRSMWRPKSAEPKE